MWKLPYTNVYNIIGSDPLHQLEQGVFRHLLDWLGKMINDVFSKTEAIRQKELINNHVKSVPNYPDLRQCNNGIFIAQLTATEYRSIEKVLF